MNTTKLGIEPLVWTDESTALDYNKWMYRLDCYLIANNIIKTNTEAQVNGGPSGSEQAKSTLAYCGGDDILTTIMSSKDYMKLTYTEIRTILDAKFKTSNSKQTKMKLMSAKPEANEKFSKFVQRLRLLARACNEENDATLLLFIAQVYKNIDPKIYRKAMENDTDLSKLLVWQTCRETNELDGIMETNELNRIRDLPHASSSRNDRIQARQWQSRPRNNGSYAKPFKPCNICGYDYNPAHHNCAAKGKKCNNCGLDNHFSSVCTKPKKNKTQINTLRVNEPDENNPIFLARIGQQHDERCPRLEIDVLGTTTKFVIDTGAGCNVMSADSFEKLKRKPTLDRTQVQLFSYNSKEMIPLLGEFSISTRINNITGNIKYIVVDSKYTTENLLGYASLVKFGVVQLIHRVTEENRRDFTDMIKRDYSKVFEPRIGKMVDMKVSIETDPSFRPVQQTAYKIPYHLIPGSMAKLNEMVDMGIIEKVPPDAKVTWISPMLPVEKHERTSTQKGRSAQQRAEVEKSRIRITSDNKRLNNAIKRMKSPMPSVSELQYDLNGKKCFSKIDIRDAFSQIELDEDSRILTTFATPWGLYRYKRLNMGLCIASEIFQEVMTSKLAGLHNIKIAIDDILVFGSTNEEHDEALQALMKRVQELGLTVNEAKCIFKVTEIEFFGMHISSEGIRPKISKLEDFMEAEAPKDVKQLRSLVT